jgi:tetratricopeptide (TPR) repeat protein
MAILASVADAALHGRKGTVIALGKAGFALKAAFSAATVAGDAYEGLSEKERARSEVELAHELFCFARGLLALAASMIPPSLSWLTDMIGVKGSRAEARSLFSSIPEDAPKAIESQLLLLLMDMVWGGPEVATAERVVPAMRAINDKYCDGVSPLIWSATGGAARYLGSWQEALDAYRAAVSHGEAASLAEFVVTQHYWLGQIAWFRGDFDAALKYCAQFTEETSGVNFKPYAGYIAASVLLMQGDAAGARDWFTKVVEWARPNQSYDTFAKRQAQKYLAGEFDDFDAVWLRAYAAHEGKDYQRAMNELAKCVPMLKSCKERRNRYALFYWLKGSCLRTSPAKQEKAREHLVQAIQQEEFMDTDLFAVAYARVELGEMALEGGDLERAEELFREAKGMSGYDWEKLLTSRIGRGLDKVSEAKAAA